MRLLDGLKRFLHGPDPSNRSLTIWSRVSETGTFTSTTWSMKTAPSSPMAKRFQRLFRIKVVGKDLQKLLKKQLPTGKEANPSFNRFSLILHRRDAMIRLGTLGSAFALPSLLQANAVSPRRGSADSCIYLFLWGGPPQQDTFDLKPDA